MATKKQKREAALARREAYLEEIRQSGLEALERDRQEQAAESARIQEQTNSINRRHANILRASLSASEYDLDRTLGIVPSQVEPESATLSMTSSDMLRLLIQRNLEQCTVPKRP